VGAVGMPVRAAAALALAFCAFLLWLWVSFGFAIARKNGKSNVNKLQWKMNLFWF
jgi:hypothetical protein